MAELVAAFDLQVRVLGPVDVRVPTGAPSPGLAPKPRHLLAILAAHRGNFVSIEAIIDELWADVAIPSATKTLQGFIFRLRQTIGPPAIMNRRGSYALSGAVPTDLVEFTQLVDRLDSFRATDRSPEILDVATQVERLWRATPFSDVPDTPTIVGARRPLVEMHSRVRRLRIDAQLDLGRASEIVGELRALVTREPLREDHQTQLMRALFLCGRAEDALGVANDARRILATELGLEPGPRLRLCEDAILRADLTAIRTGVFIDRS
jgi:SARP family transcriptional regulator, regulator of embCAB operon